MLYLCDREVFDQGKVGQEKQTNKTKSAMLTKDGEKAEHFKFIEQKCM